MKKILAWLWSVLLLLGILSGCGQQQQKPNVQLPSDLDLKEPFVGFLTEIPKTVDLAAYQRMDHKTFDSYQSENAAYGTDVYYSTLSETAQRVYHIFQYAMDHGKTSIFLDDRILMDLGVELDEIVLFLALDNAMLEQNLSWSRQDVTMTISGQGAATTFSGTILNIEEFSQGKMDKKQEALKKAQQILAEMDAGLSDREKAEYFYRYLGQNVQYFSAYGKNEKPDYLYDALLTGKTNCDGFANAYSLLCSLAGIDCAEKMYTPDDPTQIGHTWTMICLDGVWYNVDATGSQEVNGEYGIMSHFCVADDRLEYPYSYKDRLPACNQDLIQPDCIITDADDSGDAVKKAYDSIRNTDRNYILVLFTEGEQDSDTMRDIANTLGMSITTQYYITGSGDAVYYIFPEK